MQFKERMVFQCEVCKRIYRTEKGVENHKVKCKQAPQVYEGQIMLIESTLVDEVKTDE